MNQHLSFFPCEILEQRDVFKKYKTMKNRWKSSLNVNLVLFLIIMMLCSKFLKANDLACQELRVLQQQTNEEATTI